MRQRMVRLVLVAGPQIPNEYLADLIADGHELRKLIRKNSKRFNENNLLKPISAKTNVPIGAIVHLERDERLDRW